MKTKRALRAIHAARKAIAQVPPGANISKGSKKTKEGTILCRQLLKREWRN